MQLKTSWYKKEVGKRDLRQSGWIGVLYLVVLIFALPLELLMRETSIDPTNYYLDDTNLFNYHPEVQILSMFIAPVLLGVFLLRYLQVKTASDFIHSLPIKRTKLLNHHIINGIILLLLPVLLTAICLAIMDGIVDLSNYFNYIDLGYWLGVTIIVTILMFITTIFVGVITGISVVQGVLTYIIILFPAGFIFLSYFNLDFLLIGFAEGYYWTFQVSEFSPITDFVQYYEFHFSLLKAVIYIGITVVLYLLSVQFYKRRKLEAASQALVYPQLRPIFKYGVTFCTTMLGGFYYGETQNHDYWVLIGYLIGSLVGYLLAEMLLQKTWRIYRSWKGYLYYTIGITCIFLIISFDLTGYENRIPEINEIEQVYVGEYPYQYVENTDHEVTGENFLDTEVSINAARALHRQLIDMTGRNHFNETYYRQMYIAYQLKNGKKVVREYPIIMEEKLNPYIEPVYESKQYKDYTNPVLGVEPNRVSKITFSADPVGNKKVAIVKPNEIEEVLNQIEQDIYDKTADEVTNPRVRLTSIEILMDDNDTFLIEYETSFENMDNWLQQNGYYNDAFLVSDEVSRIGIVDANDENGYDQLLHESESSEDILFITKEEEKKQILNNLSRVYRGYDENNLSLVGLYIPGEPEPYVMTMEKKLLPEFVTEYLE
ncbi:DUF6449 domain-containing protein [Aquibacillus kalidii]|uniref:DUF6449 domain-containing protein n=1 Tax=Aquibacillus kalidii TaxID=2762597 RepID=UPI0016442864|nr:DUF6449 domain-containing protein [Aquibacillus kalidii]